RAASPLIDLALLGRRPLLVAHLGALMLGVNQFLCYVLVPRLAEQPPFGLSVTGAALVLLPGTLVVRPVSWLAAPVERRVGARVPLVVGLVLAAAGAVLLAAWHGRGAEV